MASTLGFLAVHEELNLVRQWFANQTLPVTSGETENQTILHFHSVGEIRYWAEDLAPPGTTSPQQWKRMQVALLRQAQRPGQRIPIEDESPLAVIRWPRQIAGVLWSMGEVTFTPSRLRSRFPSLARVASSFSRWLAHFELVHGRSFESTPEVKYHLEGFIQNSDFNVYALPRAAAALRDGQYFVNDDISDAVVDKLLKQLRLRGAIG
jgi:hypothetical protein